MDLKRFIAFVSTLLLAGALSAVPLPSPAEAFDHTVFCAEKIDLAEKDQLEAGVWLDEFTRNESVSVQCSMRMIEFRRYLDLPSGELDDALALASIRTLRLMSKSKSCLIRQVN